ncbi:RNase H1/viroplasmin domain-containing protein [Aspergillus homomorphus CBS 101889]|uniref:ribonuclease H n=1 Tax=Aspergillus homomorphus (strain CBS 101889) TaxID=1450537 RepID=A0A395I7I3_ASPHC|nr:hypothetical protein BO97DRAFT_362108 [Aspergillus homomorphus CBS 101889]RAL15895.1 hypothetical protein BO97DRAFT_362108 [Aspergillus homomorphus CBS 101889]
MRREKKKFYAVVSGRVAEATIFSSWGDAHPHITGCLSVHEGFETLPEAQKYMMEKGIDKPKLVIHDDTKETRPQPHSGRFYAVAFGRRPGVYLSWKDAEPQVKDYPHACHKRFATRAQAQAFIRDWEESHADICRGDAIDKLGKGLRPTDLESNFHDLQLCQGDDLSEGITTGMRNICIAGSEKAMF